MQIALLGNVALDITVYTDCESLESSQKEFSMVDNITTRVGGCSFNLGKAMLKNGVQPILHSLVAKDETGTMLINQLQNQQIETDTIIPILNNNNKTVLFVKNDGNKEMFLYSAPTPPVKALEVLFVEPLISYKYLHIVLNKWNTSLIKIIKENNPGIALSTDLHLNIETIDRDVVPYMTIVFFSGAGSSNHEAVIKNLMSAGPELVICTLGERGCMIGESKSHTITHFEAVKQKSPMIDTVGAGDVFAATFLTEYYGHKNIGIAAIKASIQAGKSCTQMGLDHIYDQNDLEKEMKAWT